MEKYALITGASGEIGKAIAVELANEGYSLYLHYRANKDALFLLEQDLKNKGVEVALIQADLSEKEGLDRLFMQINHSVDLVVHNSGSTFYGLLTDMEDRQTEQMIQLNLTSPIMLTKRLLPAMVSKKHGRIIIVSSIWGLTGAACEVVYSAVKGGLNTFVKALAKEVAPSGIAVNGVAPGAIETKMLDELTEEDRQLLCDEIPMGRLGRPREVAQLVAYLSSDKATYINGEIISINGAWH